MTVPIAVYGEVDQRAVDQLTRCAEAGDAVRGVLCADAHIGYSQPMFEMKVMLRISEAAYWIGQLIATLGGVAGGSEHPSVRHGAIRGALAGGMFGTGLVIAHEASQAPALATLPSPAVVMIAVTGAVGSAMGALGATLSKRLRDAGQSLR
jgi:hypothetical protein